MKIMIVENCETDMAVMSKILEKAGHQVIQILVAYKAQLEEVMKRVLADIEQTDLLLLDHDLYTSFNRLDGRMIAERLKTFPHEKMYGIGSVANQTYCYKQFKGKDDLEFSSNAHAKFVAFCTQ
jgi:CheY-like chemotaxis protein